MNWLGKVFVVLILIMSLLFMGLAMAVYATHRNWREVVEGPAGRDVPDHPGGGTEAPIGGETPRAGAGPRGRTVSRQPGPRKDGQTRTATQATTAQA